MEIRKYYNRNIPKVLLKTDIVGLSEREFETIKFLLKQGLDADLRMYESIKRQSSDSSNDEFSLHLAESNIKEKRAMLEKFENATRVED